MPKTEFSLDHPNLFARWSTAQISKGGNRRTEAKKAVKRFLNARRVRQGLEKKVALAEKKGGKHLSRLQDPALTCDGCGKYYKVCECQGCYKCKPLGAKHPKQRCAKCHPIGSYDPYDSYDSDNMSDQDFELLSDNEESDNKAVKLILSTYLPEYE